MGEAPINRDLEEAIHGIASPRFRAVITLIEGGRPVNPFRLSRFLSISALILNCASWTVAGADEEPPSVQVAPIVSSFFPAGGPAGTLVFVSGSGFTGATSVRFNGQSTSFSVTNDGQITATVPAAASTGAISVTTPGGTGASSTAFYVGSAPTVTSLSPSYGAAGAVITIGGTSFNGATGVSFSGHAATFSVTNATQLQATVPNDAATGFVTVMNPAGSGTSSGRFYLPPVISGFIPAGAPQGTQITISGSGFTIASSVK